MRTNLLWGFCAVAMAAATAPPATAQQPPRPAHAQATIPLFDSADPSAHPSYVIPPPSTRPTAAELRQARALYQSQMQVARIEAAQWMGYHLSRPNVPAIPMMTSRYAPRRTVIVPVYILPTR